MSRSPPRAVHPDDAVLTVEEAIAGLPFPPALSARWLRCCDLVHHLDLDGCEAEVVLWREVISEIERAPTARASTPPAMEAAPPPPPVPQLPPPPPPPPFSAPPDSPPPGPTRAAPRHKVAVQTGAVHWGEVARGIPCEVRTGRQ